MSTISQDRSSRWQDIQNALQFIQSTLPFRGSDEQYEVFIQDLVRNLFGEGNDVYSEGDWAKSIELYTEALSVADYAASESINVSADIKEKLYANRAAAYQNVGLHDEALEDCMKALQLNETNHRALYRKALCLKEKGRHHEAYEAVAKCSLAVPQDPSVMKLTQELAKLLGLKIRKAYVRSKPAFNVLPGSSNSSASADKSCEECGSVEDIELGFQAAEATGGAPPHTCPTEKVDAEMPPVSRMSSMSPIESLGTQSVSMPLLPLVNGAGVQGAISYPVPESRLESYDTQIIGDELDELLDCAVPVESPVNMKNIPLASSRGSGDALPALSTPPASLLPPIGVPFPSVSPVTFPQFFPSSSLSGFSDFGLDTFPSALDALDSLSLSDSQAVSSRNLIYVQPSFLPMVNSDKGPVSASQTAGTASFNIDGFQMDVSSNGFGQSKTPLHDTHEFRMGCSDCFIKSGRGLLDYTLQEQEHKCKNDVLLARVKNNPDQRWNRIRPRPVKNQYMGHYYICKDVAAGGECRYPGHCTFAYCQEEIDVWTLERNGLISRDLLVDPMGASRNVDLSVSKILQEHQGMFMFLCEDCFDNKPRIISKVNKDNPSLCSHPITKHVFKDRKCLVHKVGELGEPPQASVRRENTVHYSKIRPYGPQCQVDLCRHAVRYGCVREDACFFAHSVIELKVWNMQRQLGISHEDIVLESNKYWNTVANSQGCVQTVGIHKFGPAHLNIRFVCGQCWRNGQVIEADKSRKYCAAKGRHPWTKDKRTVLVSSKERKKWTQIRPLPTKKPIPSQFEICIHVSSGKKCQYIGNCSFAHSLEERDLWMFMKDSNISDMDQLYELWLRSQKPSEEASSQAARENSKHIHMPTDYAEEVAGNHCWLCGKNCNSERQWQQHITSEKHKDKVFNSEDDRVGWQYRFPTGTFRVCQRYVKGTCTDAERCEFAHGQEELDEWRDRREFLMRKLAKAKADHLIAPNDNDFGKYSFLLKEIDS